MSLFITCPVESVERATAFYTALGWTLNTEMSDHNVSCFAIAPNQYVMLGSREMYASVGGVESLVVHPASMWRAVLTDDQLVAAGLRPGLVRLACGQEDPADLIDDLDRALDALHG